MTSPKKVLSLCAVIAILSGLLVGQQTAQSAAIVPRMVNYSGRAMDAKGAAVSGVAGVSFAIYKDQYEGAPLWLETQSVTADTRGAFNVQLGATKAEGLPLELFSSGEARWLGVRVNGGEEQPRVMLLSVPYALKAGDAATLGGMPLSTFVLAAPVSSGPSLGGGAAASPSSSVAPPATSNVTTTGGTVNTLPLFTTGTNVQSSALTQTGTGTTAKIGIGTATPAATLDVKGPTLVRGTLGVAVTGNATAAAGKGSQPVQWTASSFNSGTSAPVNQNLRWQAESAGNDTTSPSATLNFLYGAGTATPTETGLKIASNGRITFAPGQTFPGGNGTVTSVGLSAPASDFTLSGSPVISSGTLGLKWNVAPTNASTANAIVKRDATGSFNAGAITASLGVTGMNAGGGVGGVTGQNSSAGYGVLGTATGTAGIGVWGESVGTLATNDGNGPDGVHGVTHANLGSGVAGINTASGGVGTYGQGIGYGVYGAAAGNGKLLPLGTGVYGSSFGGSGVAGESSTGAGVSGTSGAGAGVSGNSSSGTGVYGSSSTGNAFVAVGNASQDRASGGWVKGMVLVNGESAPYNIVRCFNSTLSGAAASTPPCGFVLGELAVGDFTIDFGFKVDDRFYSTPLVHASTEGAGAQTIWASPYFTANKVEVFTYENLGDAVGAVFFLFVY